MISNVEISRLLPDHRKIHNGTDAGKKFEFKIRILRALIFILLFFWCAGFSFTALFPGNEMFILFYPALKKIYSGFCHQDIEKSIFIGRYFLVCARCCGIYSGALMGAFSSIFFLGNKKNLSIKTCLVSFVPMISDIFLYHAGFYSYSIPAAFFTGMIPGSALIFLLLGLIENNFFYNNKGLH